MGTTAPTAGPPTHASPRRSPAPLHWARPTSTGAPQKSRSAHWRADMHDIHRRRVPSAPPHTVPRGVTGELHGGGPKTVPAPQRRFIHDGAIALRSAPDQVPLAVSSYARTGRYRFVAEGPTPHLGASPTACHAREPLVRLAGVGGLDTSRVPGRTDRVVRATPTLGLDRSTVHGPRSGGIASPNQVTLALAMHQQVVQVDAKQNVVGKLPAGRNSRGNPAAFDRSYHRRR